MSVRVCEVRVALARQEDCEVCLCEHGVLHVTVGGVTVHLDRRSFERLCGALHSAEQRLALEEQLVCRGRLA
jgi:hypothetical protein